MRAAARLPFSGTSSAGRASCRRARSRDPSRPCRPPRMRPTPRLDCQGESIHGQEDVASAHAGLLEGRVRAREHPDTNGLAVANRRKTRVPLPDQEVVGPDQDPVSGARVIRPLARYAGVHGEGLGDPSDVEIRSTWASRGPARTQVENGLVRLCEGPAGQSRRDPEPGRECVPVHVAAGCTMRAGRKIGALLTAAGSSVSLGCPSAAKSARHSQPPAFNRAEAPARPADWQGTPSIKTSSAGGAAVRARRIAFGIQETPRGWIPERIPTTTSSRAPSSAWASGRLENATGGTRGRGAPRLAHTQADTFRTVAVAGNALASIRPKCLDE
jgi:hypothetical protein